MTMPDWKLPPGVDRGVWDYVHSPTQAEAYDEVLAGTPLLEHDLQFTQTWLTPVGSLIDLGCGTGRLLMHLAPLGYRTVGVDLSEPMLLALAYKAERDHLSIARWKASLVELTAIRDGVFDHAACLFSTFGMIRGIAARRRVLAEAWRILKPGGRLVIHVHNRDHLLIVPYGQRWWLRDVWRRLCRSPLAGDRTMPMPRAGADVTLHHFSRSEILDELKRANFDVLTVETIAPDRIGPLRASWWLAAIRSYGYLVAATKPK